jgi:hypothetical protein
VVVVVVVVEEEHLANKSRADSEQSNKIRGQAQEVS